MKTVVCLPTRNEIESVGLMIGKIKKLGYPIFISDDKSTDGTAEAAKRLGVKVYQRDGSGKGWGVRKAIEVAYAQGFDVLVLTDCDDTYPTDEIPNMLKFLPEYDMVVGIRDLKNIRFSHRLPNLLHTTAINLLYGARLSDINSGLRAFKIERLVGTIDAPGFDVEAQLTINAVKRGMKIKEIPITYMKRKGESKIRINDGFLILKRIIVEKFRRLPN